MSDRRCAIFLGVLLFASYAYFYQAGGWNQNSRFAMVRAISERGTIVIDAYHSATGDKARAGGHYYSDKAPGQAFFAVPFVAAARPLVKASQGNTDSPASIKALSYIGTLASSAIPMLLAALALFWIARRLGASQMAAAFATVAFGLGTPAWAYATLFMGHSLAAAGLMLAFACAVQLRRNQSRRRDLLIALGLGLAAGWATVTEYPAAPAAMMISILAMSQVWHKGWRRVLEVCVGVGAGALVCVTVLFAYHKAAFGSVWATPLQHLVLFSHVKDNPFTLPQSVALGQILFGLKRGLLPLAPVIALAPLGFILGWRHTRGVVLTAVLVVVYYLLFNAAFVTPLGGWSYGPRYIAAALPFLCLGLAWLWDRAPGWGRATLGVLGSVGVAMSLVAVSTTAQPPENFARPMTQLLWPAFVDGDLSLNHQSFIEPGAVANKLRGRHFEHDAFNWGERMGLSGLPSLLPLLLVWLALGLGFWRWRARTLAVP